MTSPGPTVVTDCAVRDTYVCMLDYTNHGVSEQFNPTANRCLNPVRRVFQGGSDGSRNTWIIDWKYTIIPISSRHFA